MPPRTVRIRRIRTGSNKSDKSKKTLKIKLSSEEDNEESESESESESETVKETSPKKKDLVEKKGRKPYNPNKNRVAIPAENTRLPDKSYLSIQKIINCGPNNTINTKELEKYLEKIKAKGFKKIELSELNLIKLGSRIAYITKDNKWRSGGFLVSVSLSTTTYDNQKTKPQIYFEYRAFNNALFSAQLIDISQIWIKEHGHKKVVEKKAVIYAKPTEKTYYPVVVKDDFDEDVIIYYARDNFIKDRFINSKKFEKILDNGWSFEDGTQEPNIFYESENELAEDLSEDLSEDSDFDLL